VGVAFSPSRPGSNRRKNAPLVRVMICSPRLSSTYLSTTISRSPTVSLGHQRV
jgi:hypothetical protein